MEPLTTASEVVTPLRPGHLELLNRSGSVVRRFALSAGPLTLGRDPGGAVVLDDPYVCPRHALLREEVAGLVVEDCASVNGISSAPGQPRVARLHLASGMTVRVGRSTLRYRSAAAPLPATLVDGAAVGPLRLCENPVIIAGFCLLAPLLLLLKTYLATVTRVQGGKLLFEPVVTVVIIICWAALWSFAGRLLSYRWHFWIHFGIGCAGLVTFLGLDVVSGYLCFAINLDPLQPLVDNLGQTAALALLLFAHLRFVSAAPSRPLGRAAVLVSLAVLGLTFLTAHSDSGDFNTSPEYRVTLKAPPFQLVKGRNVADFMTEASGLTTQLAERAAKKE